MKNIVLRDVTLVGVDCIDMDRLLFVFDVCRKHISFGAMKLLTHLPSENEMVVKIDPLTSLEQYSRFMMKELYKFVDTKHMLIVQHDGFILNPFNWDDDFLNYDYIGGPWWYKDNYNVGNGGFSLRSRYLMEAVATDNNITGYHPEDHVICRVYGEYLTGKGFKFAPEALANRFAREGLSRPWIDEFGFHGADIGSWQIGRFTDQERHAWYIDRFYTIFPQVREK